MLGIVKKVFDYFVWVMFFVLLILGGVIFVTNRTYPGDNLYPFKLKFEDFVLATSKILNKQVDFSIDLVAKRSNEIAKILTPKNSKETLGRLDTQVVLTASSISQMQDPAERKKAATKYIVKLNQVSSTLTEKQKEFVTPKYVLSPTRAPQNIAPTSVPAPTQEPNISQQIAETQNTVEQTIEEMNDIVNQPAIESPTPTITPQPTSTPMPTSNPNMLINEQESQNNSDKKNNKKEEAPTVAPTDIPQPTIQDNTPIPTEVPISN
ncbi:MAG: hypothetical protein WC741_03200 [Patescibacteria group bacterium]|jgi:hypothetical protein